jgi:hypothetical protein
VLLWKRRDESSRRPGRNERRAGAEEVRVSHLRNVGSGYEAGGSDASAGNGAGAGRTNQAEGRGLNR